MMKTSGPKRKCRVPNRLMMLHLSDRGHDLGQELSNEIIIIVRYIFLFVLPNFCVNFVPLIYCLVCDNIKLFCYVQLLHVF